MACLLGCCCCEQKDESVGGKRRSMSESPMKRSVCCTDIIFLIIFVAFWIVMLYIGVFAFTEGVAFRLLYGADSFGNTCNSDRNSPIPNVTMSGQNTLDKMRVLFFDGSAPFSSVQLCVKICPDADLLTKEDLRDYSKETDNRLCYYDIEPEEYTMLGDESFSGKGPCPRLPILKSIPVMNRCVPMGEKGNAPGNASDEILDKINNNGWVNKISHDMMASWRQIISLCFIALGIALVLVLVMRFVAGIIVWLTMAICAIGSLAATGFLWWTYVDIGKNEINSDVPIDSTNRTLFLVLAIISSVFTVILLLLMLIMRSRIALVVALFKEAGKCIAKMPSVLLQPMWTFIILIVFLVYALAVLAFLSASGEAKAKDRGFNGSLAVTYTKTPQADVFWWIHLVGLIWTAEFILACQQMVVAGAVAFWFFTRDKSGLCCVVAKSVCRVALHHLGSVAFGSFIITLVKLPRLILMYIQKQATGAENILMKFVLKCCMCCLWCLEKMLKFLNQNAYTIVVLEGKSFCPAAKDALSIIVSNALRVAAINSVGDFVLFLGKIAVAATTTAISVLWLKENKDLHFWAIPVVFIGVFAFLIAHCFLSIYEMVIDTLLLCFCEDCKLNDGSDGHEYFMNESLMHFVDNSDKALRNLKKRRKRDKQDKQDKEVVPI